MPYSLSRWTDVPIAKWDWFKAQLAQGWMAGFDPRTAVPSRWSLAPEDVLGLIFWTKNPSNLIKSAALLAKHPLVVHVTLTGWMEVESGAPGIWEGIDLLEAAVNAFGPERVVWRFSPIPILPAKGSHGSLLDRFGAIAQTAHRMGLRKVYTSFLQPNDLMPEPRTKEERQAVLVAMAACAPEMQVLLCRDDQTTLDGLALPPNLSGGICEDGSVFGLTETPYQDDCGCALAVDPFTPNESCTLGCQYCYAADKTLSPCRRNTT